MPKLVAVKKLYFKRWRKPGETFETNATQARILIAIGKAKEVVRNPIEPPPADLVKRVAPNGAGSYQTRHLEARRHPLDHDGDGRAGGSPKVEASGDIAALRQQYTTKFNKRPFNGWGADILRAKLAEAGE